ncbi:MAG TPA: N-acetylmuramoyl-L-alanine amidase [Acidobacteriaceae bacterium]|nr:N-acetylmuramoyl-L-alanine amidase [Acidobacteriaceae bacterium]
MFADYHKKSGLPHAGGICALLLASLLASAQTVTPPSATPPPAPSGAPASGAPEAARTAPAPQRTQPRFLVFLDAAHGGADTGARLSSQLLEKDLVLTMSVRLRSILNAHGIAVLTSRESDGLIPAVTRAEEADHAIPSACIILHATASGNGIHLFTSSLTAIPTTRFLPWDTAQGAYVEQSQRLSSEIDSAMTHAEIPVTLGRTALQPLDSFTCPAVAVEVAPLLRSASVTPVSDAEYQNRILQTLATALEQWEKDWRQHP